MQNLNFYTTDREKLTEDSIALMKSLASAVLNKNPSQLTEEEWNTLVHLDLDGFTSEMSVYSSGTRQVAQYTPNAYSLNEKFSFTFTKQYILDQVATQTTPEDRLNTYSRLRVISRLFLNAKYVQAEARQRELLKESYELDGVAAQGRHG